MFSNTSFLRLAQYNSALPTITDGEFAPLQVDSTGRLIVSQDVNVTIDALGLNGAGDDSNILMVGSEDGTGLGTRHALVVDTLGRLIIKMTDGTDELAIVKEGDSLAVAADGAGVVVYGVDPSGNAKMMSFDDNDNLKVVIGASGAASNAYSDVAVDGVVESIGQTFLAVASAITVPAGQALEIYGAHGEGDKDAYFRVVRKTAGTADAFYWVGHAKDSKDYEVMAPANCPLVITGGATITVELQARKMQGGTDLAASGTLFARLITL
jgi:hypothetical protein